MKKLLILPILAGAILFMPTEKADAGIRFNIGFNSGGYGYCNPRPYYGPKRYYYPKKRAYYGPRRANYANNRYWCPQRNRWIYNNRRY